jgi:hypothetical protein
MSLLQNSVEELKGGPTDHQFLGRNRRCAVKRLLGSKSAISF